jgi:hypothetical protein
MRTFPALLGAAAAWTIHLNASYAIVALGCASVLSRPGPWLAALTLAAAAGAVASGAVALLGWRAAVRAQHERQRVLMVVGTLAAAVFITAIVLEGVVPAFLPYCPPDG